MPIIQVFLDVPPDVAAQLAAGTAKRFGSVVRGPLAITSHLREVKPAAAEGVGLVNKSIRSLSTPKGLLAFGFVAVGAAAGATYLAFRRQAKDPLATYNSVAAKYLEAAQNGKLSETHLDLLILADEQLQASVRDECVDASAAERASEPLVAMIASYTSQLADANGFDMTLSEVETDERLLPYYLRVQRTIFRQSA